MDADAALVAVEQLPDVIGARGPIAIQNICIDEALQFEITRLFEEPVTMVFEFVDRHGGADDGKRRHGGAPLMVCRIGREGSARSMRLFCVADITEKTTANLSHLRCGEAIPI